MAKTQLAVIDDERINALDAAANEAAAILADHTMGRIRRGLAMANAIKTVESLITDEMLDAVMQLQNTSLGFRTDRDDGKGYPKAVIRSVFIEACLRGLNVVGNEINVISGRLYATKEGLTRLVREYPGLTNLKWQLHVPRSLEKGALVDADASWFLNGDPQKYECRGDTAICVRVNAGMGADAILGKAQRKLMARIYERISGVEPPDGDVEDIPPPKQSVIKPMTEAEKRKTVQDEQQDMPF